MNFWLKVGQADQWIAIPANGGCFPPGTYTILAQSPQPHFNITVDITHYHPHDLQAMVRSKRARRTTTNRHQRHIRTNDEGVGILLPAKELVPGFWEIRCQDADLIAELFGEYKTVTLRFEINPEAPFPVLPTELSQPTQPASSSLESDSVDFTADLTAESSDHSQSPADPYSVQNRSEASQEPLTTDRSVSGDHEPEDGFVDPREPLALSQKHLDGSPNEVLILVGRLGAPGDLEARVYTQGRLFFESQQRISFSPQARSATFQLPIPLPSKPWTGSLLGSLIFKPDKNKPSTSLTFTVRCRTHPDVKPNTSWLDKNTPSGLAAVQTLEAPLPLSGDLDAIPAAEPIYHWPLIPIPEYEWPEFDDPFYDLRSEESAVDPVFEPSLDPSEASFAAVVQLEEELDLESTHTTKKLIQILQPLGPDQMDPYLYSGPWDPMNPEIYPLKVAGHLVPEITSTLATLPSPRLKIPHRLQAGKPFDVTVFLDSDPFNHAYWIKIWVKEGQTQKVLDGPRWLVEPDLIEARIWQATTRMIAPVGFPSLILEAWTLTQDLKRTSPPTTLLCTIHEAEPLPQP